jgi:hypothetical protein
MKYPPLELGTVRHIQTRLERLPVSTVTENIIQIDGDFLTEVQIDSD